MARTRRGECVHPSRAHVGAGDQTPLLDGGRCRCAISLLRWGARERVGEEHERGRKKPNHPESSLLNCGNRRNAHHDTKFLRLRDFS